MELKNFIAHTLSEIQEGVQMAINSTIKNGVSGAIIPNPEGRENTDSALVQEVEFDIAVTVSDEEKAGVNAGIKVVGLSAGGEDSAISKTSKISRIRFTTPIIPPVTNAFK